jgi:ribosomal protein S4E
MLLLIRDFAWPWSNTIVIRVLSIFISMSKQIKLKDGDECTVVAGTHAGKSGTVQDINTSKTGHITITVVQKNGVRFKTLGKNAVVKS